MKACTVFPRTGADPEGGAHAHRFLHQIFEKAATPMPLFFKFLDMPLAIE